MRKNIKVCFGQLEPKTLQTGQLAHWHSDTEYYKLFKGSTQTDEGQPVTNELWLNFRIDMLFDSLYP